jgi:hypothetical protein
MYLGHMPDQWEQGLMEARQLAVFIGCPLKIQLRSVGPARGQERQESPEEMDQWLDPKGRVAPRVKDHTR